VLAPHKLKKIALVKKFLFEKTQLNLGSRIKIVVGNMKQSVYYTVPETSLRLRQKEAQNSVLVSSICVCLCDLLCFFA